MSSTEPLDLDSSPARPERIRDVPWKWFHVVLTFAPLFLSPPLMRLLEGLQFPSFPLGSFVAWIVPFVWMIAYPVGVAARDGVPLPPLPRSRVVLVEGLIAVGLAIVLIIENIVIFNIFSVVDPTVPEADRNFEGVFASSKAIVTSFTIVAVTIGPIAEEIAFRGVLYNALRQRIPTFLALVIQAALFGLSHPFHWTHRLMIALMGLWIGVAYEWRKTLTTPIVMHVIMNTFAFLVMSQAAGDRPILGVRGDPAGDPACRVFQVVPNSPAKAADLKPGDVITAIDQEPVASHARLREIIRSRKPGDQVIIHYEREGKSHEVSTTLKRQDDL